MSKQPSTMTLSPSQTAEAVLAGIRIGRPIFIWGAPGIGKSDVVAQVAAEDGRELRDVRLNLLDPTDIKGFPVPNQEHGFMEWLPADFFPPMMVQAEIFVDKNGVRLYSDDEADDSGFHYEDGTVFKITAKNKPIREMRLIPNESKGVLFLDELNQAPPAVQAAAYQLLLTRKVGNYTLPKGWALIGAGNRESDRSNAQRMPAALALRLIHVDMMVSPDDWCAWALDKGRDIVPVELLAFVRFRPDLLHNFDPSRRVSPNPRSWTFVGSLQNEAISSEVKFAMMAGSVGDAEAGEYKAFADVFTELPSVEQIKLDPEGTPLPDKPATYFALTAALAAATTKDIYGRLKTYVDRMKPEWQIVYTRDAMRRTDRAICSTKEFQTFAVNHSHLLS